MKQATLRLSQGYPDIAPHLRGTVKTMQRQLLRMGFNVRADGLFGPTTEAAIKYLQRRRNLRVDGIVGLRTWQVLADPKSRNLGAGFRSAEAKVITRVNVPWYSQLDEGHVDDASWSACFRACRAMAKAVGVHVPKSTANRLQVATAEDTAGHVETTRALADTARRYIDEELAAGRPVTVGVSHKDANYNSDGITDHYVLITARMAAGASVTYLYHDPATRHAKKGMHRRFHVDPKTGNLVHEGKHGHGEVTKRHTEMSMVVKNLRPYELGGGGASKVAYGERLPQDRIVREPEAKPQTGWIEVILAYANGEPVANEAYEIKLPDGLVRKGQTNAEGKVYLQGIEDGECDFTFPNLDEDAWKPA